MIILETNTALSFALCFICHSTSTVHFIQTGGSATLQALMIDLTALLEYIIQNCAKKRIGVHH